VVRILLHRPGLDTWQRVSEWFRTEIAEGSVTLDSPTSLVAFSLKPEVTVERAREIATQFARAIDPDGSVEVDVS